MTAREELVMLLEERTLSHFERRKRRLQRISWPVTLSAIRNGWESDRRVTREEWIVIHMGWVPEEREQLIRFFESRGYKRCRSCGRRVVSDGPHDRCAACGSPPAAPVSETWTGSGLNS
jgi:hypothetical protein